MDKFGTFHRERERDREGCEVSTEFSWVASRWTRGGAWFARGVIGKRGVSVGSGGSRGCGFYAWTQLDSTRHGSTRHENTLCFWFEIKCPKTNCHLTPHKNQLGTDIHPVLLLVMSIMLALACHLNKWNIFNFLFNNLHRKMYTKIMYERRRHLTILIIVSSLKFFF